MPEPITTAIIVTVASALVSAIKALIADSAKDAARKHAQATFASEKAKGLKKIEALQTNHPVSPVVAHLLDVANDVRAAILALKSFMDAGGSSEAVRDLAIQTTEVFGELVKELASDPAIAAAAPLLLLPEASEGTSAGS